MIKDYHCCHCYHNWKQHSTDVIKCPNCNNYPEGIISPGEESEIIVPVLDFTEKQLEKFRSDFAKPGKVKILQVVEILPMKES
jgi:hypothetical protein